jgi:hypothetical protein
MKEEEIFNFRFRHKRTKFKKMSLLKAECGTTALNSLPTDRNRYNKECLAFPPSCLRNHSHMGAPLGAAEEELCCTGEMADCGNVPSVAQRNDFPGMGNWPSSFGEQHSLLVHRSYSPYH